MLKVRTYKGFEIGDLKLTEMSKKVLSDLKENGSIAFWDNDDSEYETIRQMTQIAHEIGGRILKLEHYRCIQNNYFSDKDKVTIPYSGRYCFILE